MKLSLIVLFSFLTFSALAQTELEKKYAVSVCECLSQKGKDNELSKNNFVECFKSSLAPYQELIKTESLRLYGDTSYLSGYRLGGELSKNTMVSLVNDCDTYFHLVDTVRYSPYNEMNKDSLQKSFTEMNQLEQKDVEFLVNRAHAAFILKKYEMALVDIQDILAQDSLNVRSIAIKAWIYELNKEYAASYKLYTQVAEITKNVSFKIFAELVKRKERELKKNS